MHTKKTNNTNKLMQISYHSALTKIQKLQNLKKKKNFFLYRPVLPEIGRYDWYFFWYETWELYVLDCLPVRYISAVPTGTVQNWLSCDIQCKSMLLFTCWEVVYWQSKVFIFEGPNKKKNDLFFLFRYYILCYI